MSRIRQERERRGWSQFVLAHEAGVSLRTVVRIEQGHSTNVRCQAAVSRALGLDAIPMPDAPPEPTPDPITALRHVERALAALRESLGDGA